jgi:hypothetical protein
VPRVPAVQVLAPVHPDGVGQLASIPEEADMVGEQKPRPVGRLVGWPPARLECRSFRARRRGAAPSPGPGRRAEGGPAVVRPHSGRAGAPRRVAASWREAGPKKGWTSSLGFAPNPSRAHHDRQARRTKGKCIPASRSGHC